MVTSIKSQSEEKIDKQIFQIEQIIEEIILRPEITKLKIRPVDSPLENDEGIKMIISQDVDSTKIIVYTSSFYEIQDSNIIIEIEEFPVSGRWIMREPNPRSGVSIACNCDYRTNPDCCKIPIYEKVAAKYKSFPNPEFLNLEDKLWVRIPQNYMITYYGENIKLTKNKSNTCNFVTRDVCISLLEEEVIPAEMERVSKNIVTYLKNGFASKLFEEKIEDSSIKIIQKVLKEKGFYNGDLDGVVTNQLNEGLENYQYSIKEEINSLGQLLDLLKLL